MEMHLVHVNKKYLDDIPKALTKPDGLAVVGIMFVVGGSEFAPLTVCFFKFINEYTVFTRIVSAETILF